MIWFMLGVATVAWGVLAPMIIGALVRFLLTATFGAPKNDKEMDDRQCQGFAVGLIGAFVLWVPMVLLPFVTAM